MSVSARSAGWHCDGDPAAALTDPTSGRFVYDTDYLLAAAGTVGVVVVQVRCVSDAAALVGLDYRLWADPLNTATGIAPISSWRP